MALAFRLLPRYIIVFGPFYGLVTFINAELLQKTKIKIRSLKHSMTLRRNTTDLAVFREVFLFKLYNLEVPNPKVIIDGGGNIGLTSVSFSVQYPEAKIYCVEPSETNFRILVENTRYYPLVNTIQSALWNIDTHLSIVNKDDNAWAYVVKECPAETPDSFVATSIKTLMFAHDIDCIDILKLDVEGAERELFIGNYDYWIRRTKYIIIELNDWINTDCSKTVFKTISEYHFHTKILNGMLLFVNQDIK